MIMDRSKDLKINNDGIQSDASDEQSKKRYRQEELDTVLLTSEDFSKLSRSERKRHREKKRRSDVNKGFDDLMSLLVEIDPDIRAEAEDRARRGQFKGSIGAMEDNLLSRVDLITRTVEVLKRVHQENEERKTIISYLTNGSSTGAANFTSQSFPTSVEGSLQRSIQGPQPSNSHFIDQLPNNARNVSSLTPMHASATDSISLRAAVERNQIYTRALLSDIHNPRAGHGNIQQRSMLRDLPGAFMNDRSSFNVTERNFPLIGDSFNPSFPGISRRTNVGLLSGGGVSTELAQRYLQLIQENESVARLNLLRGSPARSELLDENKRNRGHDNNRNRGHDSNRNS